MTWQLLLLQRAKSYTEDVEFSAMDATRSDRDYLCQVLEAAIEAGATTVNVPDTVGYTIPEEFADLISYIKQHVSNIERAIISVHCHNDLGLATANSLSAVLNGARQVECTINGIGERAGNTSLEEVAMILYTRKEYAQLETRIVSEEIYNTSKLLPGLPVYGFNLIRQLWDQMPLLTNRVFIPMACSRIRLPTKS